MKESIENSTFFIFLTGASGSGKTYLTKAIQKEFNQIKVFYFDDIGVPSFDDMISQHGSTQKWQEAKTYEWVEKLSIVEAPIILLEGSYNPDYVTAACKKYSLTNYNLITVHADRSVREKRLLDKRNQPDLVTEAMNYWAEFLKDRVKELGGIVIDTSSSNVESNLNEIRLILSKTN